MDRERSAEGKKGSREGGEKMAEEISREVIEGKEGKAGRKGGESNIYTHRH